MSFGVGSLGSALAGASLSHYQQSLQTAYGQASSGHRLINASIDPSGLAIYNALTTQSQGFDTANQNVNTANNAIDVAQGALSNTQGALQQLNNLAIEATNSFLSAGDRQALQAQANQLVQQINTNASQVNFNGVQLNNGQFSGNTPAAAAAATTTSNAVLGNGGNLVSQATPSAASQGGTIQVQVVSTAPGAAGAQITFTDTQTGVTTVVATVAANTTTNVNGTNVTVGNFTTNDIGANATTQVTAANPGSQNPTLNVQSGANAGVGVQVSLPNATAQGLGLANIDFSTSANATNAQGQIQAALGNVATANAQLGAQNVALNFDQDNNNVASVNLTASASAIGSANESSLSQEINTLQLQQQISIATIHQANVAFGYLNRFLNVAA
jgi:flagellin